MDFIHLSPVWQQRMTEFLGRPSDVETLKAETTGIMQTPCPSVVRKPAHLVCGDPRNYVSQGPYWWPDPEKPDGLPYLRRDGEVNPEILDTDLNTLRWFCTRLPLLVFYGRAMDSQPHLDFAGRMLRTWFLDEETKMLPHLQFAQRIPGRCEGRGIGLIDTTRFCYVLDAVTQLGVQPGWGRAELAGLKDWFDALLTWFLESDHGRDEVGQHNNHGSWYDAQVVAYACFTGREDVVRRHIDAHWETRVMSQIEADGSQPHELARKLSFNYCTFNLLAFSVTAQLASRLGIALWDSAPGQKLVQAIDWMLPFYIGEKDWRWEQLNQRFDLAPATLLLSLAWQGTQLPRYAQVLERIRSHSWQAVLSSETVELRQPV